MAQLNQASTAGPNCLKGPCQVHQASPELISELHHVSIHTDGVPHRRCTAGRRCCRPASLGSRRGIPSCLCCGAARGPVQLCCTWGVKLDAGAVGLFANARKQQRKHRQATCSLRWSCTPTHGHSPYGLCRQRREDWRTKSCADALHVCASNAKKTQHRHHMLVLGV
jgi:hypothetical protein